VGLPGESRVLMQPVSGPILGAALGRLALQR
jgi:hypothetical protein